MAEPTTPSSIILTGTAYGQRATLEITGDALTWRARKGSIEKVRENIATTTHDIDQVRYLERRFSPGGAALALLSMIWMFSESIPFGLVAFAAATALITYRAARPRRWLGLDVHGRWLVLRVDAPSAANAKTLAGRIERRLLTGEPPSRPLALP